MSGRISSMILIGFLAGSLGLGACGSLDWFVSFNAGQIEDAQENGLVLVIGQVHPKPLQDVSLVSGEIPPGMALQEDGTVRGIPEAGGTYDFTLELTEIGGKVLRRSYTVEVEGPAGEGI